MIMDKDWVRICRKIQNHWLWQNAECLKWWLDLLMLANFEDRGGIKRGQMTASVDFLCDRWSVRDECGKVISRPSTKRVLAFIKRLEDSGMIMRDLRKRKSTVLTICEYDCYQVSGNDSGNAGNDSGNDNTTCNGNEILDFFNAEMKAAGAAIPRVRSLAGRRLAFLNARLREYGKDDVLEAIRKAARSNFLNGGGKQGFKADFEWIMRPNNFPKVLEGNYDNRQNNLFINGKSSNALQPVGGYTPGRAAHDKAASRQSLEDLADAILAQHQA